MVRFFAALLLMIFTQPGARPPAPQPPQNGPRFLGIWITIEDTADVAKLENPEKLWIIARTRSGLYMSLQKPGWQQVFPAKFADDCLHLDMQPFGRMVAFVDTSRLLRVHAVLPPEEAVLQRDPASADPVDPLTGTYTVAVNTAWRQENPPEGEQVPAQGEVRITKETGGYRITGAEQGQSMPLLVRDCMVFLRKSPREEEPLLWDRAEGRLLLVDRRPLFTARRLSRPEIRRLARSRDQDTNTGMDDAKRVLRMIRAAQLVYRDHDPEGLFSDSLAGLEWKLSEDQGMERPPCFWRFSTDGHAVRADTDQPAWQCKYRAIKLDLVSDEFTIE